MDIFFSWSYFSKGGLFVTSFKGMLFLSSHLSFLIISFDSLVEMDIAFVLEFLENFMFLFHSTLPFFDSVKPKELMQQLAIVTSMSSALVTNS